MTTKRPSPRQAKHQHWSACVERWRRSGLSKAAFCRQESLSVATFHYWWRRLAQEATQAPSARAAFVPVKLSEPVGVLRVQVGDVVLSCREDVSGEQLGAWVSALRRAVCTS
jgi:transposase-like protein